MFSLCSVVIGLFLRQCGSANEITHAGNGECQESTFWRICQPGIDDAFSDPYDNAVVESTNRLVKKELIHRNVYTNVEQLRSDVNRYVWWYNHQRLHSTLGYLSPVEFTQQGKTL